jgi:hypothetical protein
LAFLGLEEKDQGGVAWRVEAAELIDSGEGLRVLDVRR